LNKKYKRLLEAQNTNNNNQPNPVPEIELLRSQAKRGNETVVLNSEPARFYSDGVEEENRGQRV